MTRLNESFAHLCALFEAKIVIWAIIILSSWCAFAATLTVDSKASGGTPGTYATLQKAVDPAAFAKGDLLGKGRRTLPVLPEDVKAALPNPNKIVVPPCD